MVRKPESDAAPCSYPQCFNLNGISGQRRLFEPALGGDGTEVEGNGGIPFQATLTEWTQNPEVTPAAESGQTEIKG